MYTIISKWIIKYCKELEYIYDTIYKIGIILGKRNIKTFSFKLLSIKSMCMFVKNNIS